MHGLSLSVAGLKQLANAKQCKLECLIAIAEEAECMETMEKKNQAKTVHRNAWVQVAGVCC